MDWQITSLHFTLWYILDGKRVDLQQRIYPQTHLQYVLSSLSRIGREKEIKLYKHFLYSDRDILINSKRSGDKGWTDERDYTCMNCGFKSTKEDVSYNVFLETLAGDVICWRCMEKGIAYERCYICEELLLFSEMIQLEQDPDMRLCRLCNDNRIRDKETILKISAEGGIMDGS